MLNDRSLIDPEDKYRADGFTQVEQHAARVLEHLPGAFLERTRDVIQINYREEMGIVIVITPETIELRLPAVEWTHPHWPASSSRLWQRLEAEQLSDEKLAELIEEAQQARLDEQRECRYCHQTFPPEHMFDDDVCHGCASKHLGVTF